MLSVNWIEKKLNLTQNEHPKLKTELAISVTADELGELHHALSMATSTNTELKIQCSAEWTVYFKLRELGARTSTSRLAHPQPNEWVASLRLTPEHAHKFMESIILTSAMPGSRTIRLSEQATFDTVANFSLAITTTS